MSGKYRQFEVQRRDEVTVVILADPADSHLSHKIQQELNRLVQAERPKRLVVSFQAVTRCTTDIVNALLRCQKRAADYGGELRLCDMAQSVKDVLSMLNLDRTVFQVFETLSEAEDFTAD